MHVRHKRLKEAAEYSALLSRTLPAVIRSEAEKEWYVTMLEELDSKGNRLAGAERRMAELLTLLIENFEEKHYALKGPVRWRFLRN